MNKIISRKFFFFSFFIINTSEQMSDEYCTKCMTIKDSIK